MNLIILSMKETLRKIPVVSVLGRTFYRKFIYPFEPFPGSAEYWKSRYGSGGDSGAGSAGKLAEYKAEVLNSFVKEHNIGRVIDFGCGDGNQLKLYDFPSYLGFEISPDAISRCKTIFHGDVTKEFKLIEDYSGETAPLTLSSDVIYHLIEEEVFVRYMERLFNSAAKYVIIYSSNTNVNRKIQAHHVKHRKFSDWIDRSKPDWKLIQHMPNRFPFKGDINNESWSEFYIYEKIQIH